MSCSSPARSPATACARSCTSASAATRTRARSEVLEPSPERIAPPADHPGVPWQVLPYERQLEIKQRAGRRGAAADRPARGLRARGDRARASSSGATATSSSTPSATRRGRRPSCCVRLPRARRRQRVIAMRRLPARLRARQPGARGRAGWCREQGLTAWDAAARGRAAARAARRASSARARRRTAARACATSSCAKGAARGQLQVRIVTTDGELEAGALAAALSEALGESLSGVLWTRSRSLAETTARRRDRAGVGRGRAARAPRRARPAHLRRGVLPDEHRDGRACSTGSSSSTPRWRAGSACTTSTAASARSRSRSPRARASCGASS